MGTDKCEKKLITNVSAYVKRRHLYIYNTNFLEKGEENSSRKTMREYLYRYILGKESDETGSGDKTNRTNFVYDCGT
jgi:hypothetical protein